LHSRSGPLHFGREKSLFYLYFLERYRAENPEKSVVTASFTESQELESCVLFRPDGSFEKCKDLAGNLTIPRKNLPTWPENIDCDLYLYDGPPKARPIGVKMIAFTSPNFDWLDSMRKNPAHRRVYMPVWKIGELQDTQWNCSS
jgi:hypothetical protein